jgi:hypothetical protein
MRCSSSPIRELLNDRTSTLLQKLELQVWASFLSFFLRSRWRKSASWFWMDFEKTRFVSTNNKILIPLFFVLRWEATCFWQCHRAYKGQIMIHFDIIRYNRGILYHISFINRHVCVFQIWQNAIYNQKPKSNINMWYHNMSSMCIIYHCYFKFLLNANLEHVQSTLHIKLNLFLCLFECDVCLWEINIIIQW